MISSPQSWSNDRRRRLEQSVKPGRTVAAYLSSNEIDWVIHALKETYK